MPPRSPFPVLAQAKGQLGLTTSFSCITPNSVVCHFYVHPMIITKSHFTMQSFDQDFSGDSTRLTIWVQATLASCPQILQRANLKDVTCTSRSISSLMMVISLLSSYAFDRLES